MSKVFELVFCLFGDIRLSQVFGSLCGRHQPPVKLMVGATCLARLMRGMTASTVTLSWMPTTGPSRTVSMPASTSDDTEFPSLFPPTEEGVCL